MIRAPYWFFDNTLTSQEITTIHKIIKENPTTQKDSAANVKKTAYFDGINKGFYKKTGKK